MSNLPSGLDWADGQGSNLGTQTVAGQIVVQSANGATTVDNIQLEELPDAEIEIAEQATLTKNFRTNYNDAITRLAGLPRGTVQTDSNGNLTKVLSVKTQRQPGGWTKLTVIAESLSFDTPPDEFSIEPVELGVDILKHPRYFYNMQPSNFIPGGLNGLGVADTAQEQEVKQAIVRAIQTFRDSPTVPILPNLYNLMTGVVQDGILAGFSKQNFQYLVPNPNYNPAYTATNTSQKPSATPPAAATADGQPNAPMFIKSFSGTSSASVNLALAAGQEVLSKLWRQEDTPYLVGLRLRWKQIYWVNQRLNLGGYVENPYFISGSPYPTSTPELPDYF